MPPDSNPSDQVPGSVVRALAWAAVAVGFVFFTGWAYAYHYFAHFSVGLAALHLPAVAFFGFAFWALRSQRPRWRETVPFHPRNPLN